MDRRHFIALSLGTIMLVGGCSEQVEPVAEGPTAQKPTIALIGATARSGREIIKQAIAQGYRVKGLARTPSKLGVEHENLEMFKGDVRDQVSLEAFLEGDEIVICMAGKGAPKDPMAEMGEVDLYTVMGANIIAAMKKKGNKRLFMASSTGVEHKADIDGEKPAPGDMSNMWRWNARYLYNDMYDMENMIRDSGLEYILLRPGFMVEEPARDDMKIDVSGSTPGARVITYEDFTAFILDELESDTYVNKAVGLYSETIMDPKAEIARFLAKEKAKQEAAKAK
jgi:putative NADH-flavin reductase